MGEPYPCKARVTVYDNIAKMNIIDNNFVHCNDVENGGKFKHSRYKVTVHERVYAQKYLDEQQAIQDQKDREAQERADERELQRILAEQKRQQEIDNNPTVITSEQEVINEVTTPIQDITNVKEVNSVFDSDFLQRVLEFQKTNLQNKPKNNNTNTILMIGGIGLISLFFLMRK